MYYLIHILYLVNITIILYILTIKNITIIKANSINGL